MPGTNAESHLWQHLPPTYLVGRPLHESVQSSMGDLGVDCLHWVKTDKHAGVWVYYITAESHSCINARNIFKKCEHNPFRLDRNR